MGKYWYAARNRFMVTTVYRTDFVFGVAVVLFRVIISTFLWRAIFEGSQTLSVQGYSYRDLIVYLLLTNTTSLIFSFDLCFKIGQLVKTGRLTTYLYRPINILYEGLFETLGASFISIPVLLAVVIYFHVNQGTSLILLFIKLAYIVLCYVLWILVLSLISLLGFRMIQMWPLKPIMRGLYMLLAGLLFPLEFFPNNIGRVIKYNPFGLVGSTLSEVIMGRLDGLLIAKINIGMIVGITVLFALYNTLLKRAFRYYEGMGA